MLKTFAMNLSVGFLLFLVCQSNAFYPHNNFEIKPLSDDDCVILSEILANYLIKYLNDDKFYISIIRGTSTNERIYFYDDFYYHLFHDPAMANFTYKNLAKLDGKTRGRRNAFCLLLIADIKSLE